MSDKSSDRSKEQQDPVAHQEGSRRLEEGDKLNQALKEEYDRRESEKSETGYRDAGQDPTLPGQREIEGGSVEHQRLLKQYPNATSYGPDVNVVENEEPQQPQVDHAKMREQEDEVEQQSEEGRRETETEEEFRLRQEEEERVRSEEDARAHEEPEENA